MYFLQVRRLSYLKGHKKLRAQFHYSELICLVLRFKKTTVAMWAEK